MGRTADLILVSLRMTLIDLSSRGGAAKQKSTHVLSLDLYGGVMDKQFVLFNVAGLEEQDRTHFC